MQRSTTSRALSRRGGALATAGLTLAALATSGITAATASTTDAPTTVSLFPTNALTVPDAGQNTGLRVALPTACAPDSTTPACGLVAGINELDGFDIDPRLSLTFDADVSVADVIASTTVTGPSGGSIGIDRVVYDSASHTVYAHPKRQLYPMTTYTLAVSSAHGLPAASSTFTTMSPADGLLDLRKQLDNGSAYTAAGIAPADRKLKIDAIVPTSDSTTLTYNADVGTGTPGVPGGIAPVQVPTLVDGTIVFGSYLAPSWLRADGTIAQVPTAGTGPTAVGATRLPFLLVLPKGKAPAGGFPTTVFGHGFSRNDADVLPASLLANPNGIATIATDVVGHGYGPRSSWTIKSKTGTVTVPAYARGVDQNGDDQISNVEGSTTLPNGAAAAVSTRDALRQTALDNMSLVRAVKLGLDVSGTPATELRAKDVSYVGQSFGGIYGAMVAGADPTMVYRSVLNVAGGPVTEVARLSVSFRPLVQQSLAYAGLLNSNDPARNNFEEDLPLRGQAPVVDPVPGALAIQQFLALTTWLDRSGSPESYAARIPAARTLLQVAFGDQTVPNPTAYTLLDAGGLFARSTLYRNDRNDSTKNVNPHGFLLDLRTFPGPGLDAQSQVVTFLKTGKIVDPDGSGKLFEVPAARSVLLPLNFANPAFP